MKVIGTGLSGMMGSRVVQLLASHIQFQNLSIETGVDITDRQLLETYILQSDAPWIFHFAAMTDVDGAEKEKSLGAQSPTWKINVTATEHLVSICRKANKKLLYVSTDYVFDGTHDKYSEDDTPSPSGFYAQTKYEAEKLVASLDTQGLIIRTANPYRSSSVGKKDFVHKIIDRLAAGDTVTTPEDQLFMPTLVDDIAEAIEKLLEHRASGIYHVVGADAVSPYKAARLIAKEFGFSESLVQPTTFASYFTGRAPRPFHAVLTHDKIQALGIHMHTFSEGLRIIAQQEQSTPS